MNTTTSVVDPGEGRRGKGAGHLLGMTEFYAGCKDIGIGFAQSPNSKYKTYVSIIIARHNAN